MASSMLISDDPTSSTSLYTWCDMVCSCPLDFFTYENERFLGSSNERIDDGVMFKHFVDITLRNDAPAGKHSRRRAQTLYEIYIVVDENHGTRPAAALP